MTMKTLNQISQEKYGKDYNHLPDDGAEQDFVQGEYSRLNHVKPVCNDLSEREQLPSCSNSSHEQYIKAEGVCPTCGTTKTFEEQNQPDKATPRPWFIMQSLPDNIPTFEGETVTVIVDEQNRNVLNGKPLLEHAANAALIIRAVNEHAALVAVASAARCVSNAIDRQDDSMIEPNDVLVKALSQLSALRQG